MIMKETRLNTNDSVPQKVIDDLFMYTGKKVIVEIESNHPVGSTWESAKSVVQCGEEELHYVIRYVNMDLVTVICRAKVMEPVNEC